MATRIYTLKTCSSCKKATAWLRGKGIAFDEIAIRETPPEPAELEAALAATGGQVKKLFNVSGQDYRSLGLKDTLPGMSDTEALALLAGNGNLIKRPFLIGPDSSLALVGFKEEVWSEAFSEASC